MAAAAVPPTINGMRRPMRVLVLSDSAPKNGSKNSASTLSAAIMAPAKVSFSLKVSVRIKVITLSYICQNVQIDKKRKTHQNGAAAVQLHGDSPNFGAQLAPVIDSIVALIVRNVYNFSITDESLTRN